MSRISVLIPCYNEERFLELALRSIVQQTLPEWEVIVVDDGSTDRSVEVVERFMRKHDYPVGLTLSSHKGCAAATDQAARLATSSLCTILDGDDYLTSDSLKLIVEAFDQHEDVEYIWSRYLCKKEGEIQWREGRSKSLPEGQNLRDAYLSGWWGALAQRSFRRDAYLESGGLDYSLPFAVDQQLALLFAQRGSHAMHLPVITYYHVQHNKQMSATHRREQQRCRGEILRRLGGSYVRER